MQIFDLQLQGFALLTFGVQSFASFCLQIIALAPKVHGAGGYALQSRALHRFAYKSEICKQNQQDL